MSIEKRYEQRYEFKREYCLYKTRPSCKEDFDYWEYINVPTPNLTIQQVKQPVEEKIRVEIKLGKTIELPIKLSKLAKAIENSKYILELEDNFDDEGSKGYKLSTWERAIDFLVNYLNRILIQQAIVLDTPKIYHGPDGSIDILWKTENYKLLVNIPEEQECPASFYGDNLKMNKIKGSFDIATFNNGLLILLLELQ